jgi:signal transduction histidine kinase
MAIKPIDFYRRFRTKALGISLLVQLAVGVLVGAWYFTSTSLAVAADNYILSLILPFAFLELIATAITLTLVSEPTKVMADAVLHATSQAGNTAPPNVDHERYTKSGLSTLVHDIYELAATGEQTSTTTPVRDEILQHILDMLPMGIILADAKGTIIRTNKKAPLHKDAVTLKSLDLQFDHENTFDAWLATCESDAIATEHTWSRVTNESQSEKLRKFYDIVASYHKDGEDGIEVVILAIDRTAEYGTTEEAMDFIALAAHELRGPITIIRGYLEVLADELDDQLDADHKELMDRLNVSASRLSGYINNILNASRYDRRHLKLHLQEYTMQNLYTPLETDLQLRARTNNRLLNIVFPNDLPTVAADKNSIEEVIVNLVDNGLKYSLEGGQVIVSAKVDGDFVEVSVQDQGIGIPASLVPNLFSKFYRSHRSRETVSGTGLGLYISKAIVESHGGTMSVRSTEGEGSTFSFTLPIYSTVADKLLASNNRNDAIIESSNGWIRNHAMFRG